MSGSEISSAEEGAQDAMDRIEAALERIAALAEGGGTLPSGASLRDVTDRLDGLIARIRAALGPDHG